MRYFLWAAITVVAFAVQGSISLFDITPNVTVILACFAGIREGEGKGFLIGSLIGIIEDSLSGNLLGPHLLSKSLTGYFSALLYSKIFVWTPVFGILTAAVFTMADSFTVYLARTVFGSMPAGFGAATFIIAMQSLFNAPLGIILRKKSE